ncbi:Lsr2 family protein [Spongiactinospora sp. TRM90649]|uniref:histone-like nucleoid-structuring protein Lsr2 n=1 Tax=Spongiactinospora sp. TRM90649 TaxID=3031114 RepID=UPI0023F83B75|nr:Lsr2 family protein [Spongiactinospora sp. TRM90649]MDF5752472.1 Lsr2 family protein [Spongiactinospora sp. TRM90649]
MAKQIKEIFIDDLDGGEATSTTKFGLDGDEYEIDLSERNEETLRKALAPYINAARPVRRERVGRKVKGSGVLTPALTRQRSKEIREWAKQHGLSVSERGRIASNVVEQYEAAH